MFALLNLFASLKQLKRLSRYVRKILASLIRITQVTHLWYDLGQKDIKLDGSLSQNEVIARGSEPLPPEESDLLV